MFNYRKFTSLFSSLIVIFSLTLSGFQPVSAQSKDSLRRRVNLQNGAANLYQDVTPTETPISTETPIPTETPSPTETSVPTVTETFIPTELPVSFEALSSESDVSALAVTLYVKASGGSDGNTCLTIALACATINGAIGKAAASGDTIRVATGTFTGTETEVVLINKSVTISGGWNAAFTTQSGTTIIDGQGSRRGIKIESVTVTVERFTIQNGFQNVYLNGGGGVFNDQGNVTLNNSIVIGNISNGDFTGGGGISNDGTMILNSSNITGNSADGYESGGAGIYNLGTITLNNSSVNGNHSGANSGGGNPGGGIYNYAYSGSVTLNNSTVSNNIAGGGAGISNQGTLNINSSTITHNTAISGGGINSSSGSVTIKNSILAGNTGDFPDCVFPPTSEGYNIIGDAASCNFIPTTGDQINVDPKISGLMGNPSYHPLLPTSSAINAGNPAGCVGSTGLLTTDQRGVARVGYCDIGAYEYTTFSSVANLLIINGDGQSAPPTFAFPRPLQVAALDNQGSPVPNVNITFTAPGSGASGTFANTGTNITSVLTDVGGIATTTTFTANNQFGAYTVSASASGVGLVTFNLKNASWYVATTGNDSNSCTVTGSPCLTINGAIGKASAGDTVKVAAGTYTADTGNEAVLINKSITLSGGWNAGFTTQNGTSIVDGGGARDGITIDYFNTVFIDHFTIQNGNAVSSGAGGGIWNKGSLTISYSTISGNSANYGGGIFNIGSLTVNNSLITDNTGSGGGLYNGGTAVINNSTVSNNHGYSFGSGINNEGGTLSLSNVTVSGNTSSSILSGGIHHNNGGLITLKNTIVAGNTDADSVSDCYGVITSNGYNLIGNNFGCTFSATAGDLVGTSASPINPFLTLLQDNGGPTLTHGLLRGSPAINAGNPASPGSGGNACLIKDQLGTSRPVSTACDIGAFEGEVPAVQISGSVGIVGAVISYTYGIPQTVTANGSGHYSISVPIGWSGTVTPSKAGYTFMPVNRSYTNLVANQTAQNYSIGLPDPSFEAFTPNPYWAEFSTNFGTPLCTYSSCGDGGGTAGPRTGFAWSWFGGVPTNEIAAVSQSVPFASGSCAALQFYFWIGAAEPGSDANDYFAAKIAGNTVFSANATQIGSYPTYTLVSVNISSYADGTPKLIEFYSNTTDQLVTFNLDDVSIVSGNCTISGNAGTSGVTLSYTDGTAKTATSLANGSYSLQVSNNWSGTVTPSHSCFTFSPTSKSYSNVATNQTSQNYTATLNPASGCANINVNIGGALQGNYGLLPGQSQKVTYNLDAGPVKIESTNGMDIVAALRDALLVNGSLSTFSQLMGLPNEQLSDTYWFPAYVNNSTLSGQLRFANVGVADTTVTVTIGGVIRGSYLLHPNEMKKVDYPLDAGPVKVQSSGGVPIVAALRDALVVNGGLSTFSQMMGIPDEQLSDTYWFPAYVNNSTLNGQLRFANVGVADTTVMVTIGGVNRGSYLLHPNEMKKVDYPLDAGPVKVQSSGGVRIVAALRDALLVNGSLSTFSQLMGIPDEGLSDTYWIPSYVNNSVLNGQLRFGNVGVADTTVTVTIGGVNRGSYLLHPNENKKVVYDLDSGPVKITSTGAVPIVAALRDALLVNGSLSTFSQLMGLPDEQLSDTYWIPAYVNNAVLNGQLRFGVP